MIHFYYKKKKQLFLKLIYKTKPNTIMQSLWFQNIFKLFEKIKFSIFPNEIL